MRKGQKHSEETLARMSAAQKIAHNRPEVKALISADSKAKWNNPEFRKKCSEAVKVAMNRSEVKAHMSTVRKGKKLSSEHCARISIATKAVLNSPEVKARHIAAMNRPEVKAKISAVHKGLKHSAEARAHMSIAQSGDKNARWLGGISFLPYSPQWTKELHHNIRERDHYTCQLCTVVWQHSEKAFPPHHIDYDKTNCDPSNLILLCLSCNVKVNARREYWTQYFQTVMAQRRDAELQALLQEKEEEEEKGVTCNAAV